MMDYEDYIDMYWRVLLRYKRQGRPDEHGARLYRFFHKRIGGH